MKVLIAPMAAIGFLHQGHVPAFCAAKEINYQPVEGVRECIIAAAIIKAVSEMKNQISYIDHIHRIQSQLMKLGSVDQAVQSISFICSE